MAQVPCSMKAAAYSSQAEAVQLFYASRFD
jgi:hypothetical protein